MQARVVKALQNRRNTDDNFRISHGYSWDHVMAFHIYDEEEPITAEQRTYNLKRILAQLDSGRLEFRLFYNTMHNVVFVKIRASHHRLQQEATRINMNMRLDETELNDQCKKGRRSMGWGPLHIPEESLQTSMRAYDHMFAPYDMDELCENTNPHMAHLYKRYTSKLLIPKTDLSARGSIVALRDAVTGEIKELLRDDDGDGAEKRLLMEQMEVENTYIEGVSTKKRGDGVEENMEIFIPPNSDEILSEAEQESQAKETDALLNSGDEESTNDNEKPSASGKSKSVSFSIGGQAVNLATTDVQLDMNRRSVNTGQYVIDEIHHRVQKNAADLDSDKIKSLMSISDGTLTYDPVDNSHLDSNEAAALSAYDDTALVIYKSIFRSVDRIKLIDSIINNHSVGGCHLNTNMLMKNECMLAYMPLHDEVALRELEQKWVTLVEFPSYQCVDDVKDYFGEKIGLYFGWLGHYTTWLFVAAFLGFLAWINVQVEDGDPNSLTMPYFAGAMAVWATLYLESFKRYEATTIMKWGMTDFESNEEARPEFYGIPTRHAVTGAPTFYYARHLRLRKTLKAYWYIFLSLGVIIGALALIFFVRFVMTYNEYASMYAAPVTSIMTALQIEALNYYFSLVAIALNDSENWRTDTEYEDGLISKAFIFQFVNAFSSLFYVAFMKPFYSADQCNAKYCFYELQASLGALFMTRLFLSNGIKLIVPLWSTSAAQKEVESIDSDDKSAKHSISEVEHAFLMPTYDALMGTFDDYSAMVSQFGYMTMFVSAFPLCTVLALVNNYFQLRVDAWRLCQVVRRPEPRSVSDIGMWYTVLELTGIISVLTNAALVSFTGQIVAMYTWVWRIWIFVLFTLFILVLKLFIAILIPDTPPEVDIQLKRNEHVTNKVLENQKDYEGSSLKPLSLRLYPNLRFRIG